MSDGQSSINKVTPGGVVSVFAGSVQNRGIVNASGTVARFNNPQAAAVDAAGNVYIADWGNSVIRKVTPEGTVTTLAGNGSYGYQDGPAISASFAGTEGVAVDASGNVYVADSTNRVIRRSLPPGWSPPSRAARAITAAATVQAVPRYFLTKRRGGGQQRQRVCSRL